MGIDIYARWKSHTAEELKEQMAAWFSVTDGKLGYLREAYHGGPYATHYLCSEVFLQKREARIPATRLRLRLRRALALAEERERNIYKSDEKHIEEVKQSFRDFVDLCERKETADGEPVLIVADY